LKEGQLEALKEAPSSLSEFPSNIPRICQPTQNGSQQLDLGGKYWGVVDGRESMVDCGRSGGGRERRLRKSPKNRKMAEKGRRRIPIIMKQNQMPQNEENINREFRRRRKCINPWKASILALLQILFHSIQLVNGQQYELLQMFQQPHNSPQNLQRKGRRKEKYY